jgi:tRNA nucleotidyltransferase (CCA-adding enzyme)
MHFPPLPASLAQHNPLFVGGCVRDQLLGRTPKDWDLAILGRTAQEWEGTLEFPFRRVGKSFSHWLVDLPEMGWVEVTLEEGDWSQSCQRRDFTCNTLAWSPAQASLLDPLGGRQDIQRGQLRQAHPHSLEDDPLRVWRAAQFCARFGWQLEPKTEASLLQVVPRLPELARERVRAEWEKLLLLPAQPSLGLELVRQWGLLDRELQAIVGCPQDPRHHPEGDVWTHTLQVVDQAASLSREWCQPRLSLLLAALLHDVGKPMTTQTEADGRITAHGHEKAGLAPASEWLLRWGFSLHTQAEVLDCVAYHMRPSQLYREIERQELSLSQQCNALRRLMKCLEAVSWDVFLTLCRADHLGRGPNRPDFEAGTYLEQLRQSQPPSKLSKDGLLRGRDLLALGLRAGPELGEWLDRVENERDLGHLSSSEEALEWVKLQLQSKTS